MNQCVDSLKGNLQIIYDYASDLSVGLAFESHSASQQTQNFHTSVNFVTELLSDCYLRFFAR